MKPWQSKYAINAGALQLLTWVGYDYLGDPNSCLWDNVVNNPGLHGYARLNSQSYAFFALTAALAKWYYRPNYDTRREVILVNDSDGMYYWRNLPRELVQLPGPGLIGQRVSDLGHFPALATYVPLWDLVWRADLWSIVMIALNSLIGGRWTWFFVRVEDVERVYDWWAQGRVYRQLAATGHSI